MAAFEFSYPQLQQGDVSDYVKIMQHLCQVRGAALPRYGCDGDFGAETAGALRFVQACAGLEIDGICGILTWSYLLTGEVIELEN